MSSDELCSLWFLVFQQDKSLIFNHSIIFNYLYFLPYMVLSHEIFQILNAQGQSEIFFKGSNFLKILTRHVPPFKILNLRAIKMLFLSIKVLWIYLQGIWISLFWFYIKMMWWVTMLFSHNVFFTNPAWNTCRLLFPEGVHTPLWITKATVLQIHSTCSTKCALQSALPTTSPAMPSIKHLFHFISPNVSFHTFLMHSIFSIFLSFL